MIQKLSRAIIAFATICLSLMPGVAFAERTYVVQPGDTLSRIARRFHLSIEQLQDANGLRGANIRDGLSLIIPSPSEIAAAASGRPTRGRSARAPRESAATRRQREALARASRLGVGTDSAARDLLFRHGERRWFAAAGAARPRGTLQMPVPGGRFGRGWGSGEGGYHLAVDISAAAGTPIKAVEQGIVVYAGHGLRGYGNLVLVAHSNGWTSGYAHNRENLVVAGEMVRRGQTIARLGSTGASQGPHLHFMLVFEGNHCDPLPLFRPAPSGARIRRPLRWQRTRPAELQCLPRSARPHPHPYRGHSHATEENDPESDMNEGASASDSSPSNSGTSGHSEAEPEAATD